MINTKYKGTVDYYVIGLCKHFPISSLVTGRIIMYCEIERILGLNKNSYPFYPVIRKWKDHLLQSYNIAFVTITKIGYKVADDHQKLSLGNKYEIQFIRRLKRSVEHYNAIDQNNLSEREKKSLTSKIISNISILTAIEMNRELPMQKI